MQQADIRQLKTLLEQYCNFLIDKGEELPITDDDDYGDPPYAKQLDLIDRVIEYIKIDLKENQSQ